MRAWFCALLTAAALMSGAPADAAETPLIVVDQFGYLPDQAKVAVLREPVVGFDAGAAYAPGARLQVLDARTGAVVLTGSAEPWRRGAVDTSSGDRAWLFDFSALRTPGRYEIADPEHGVVSPPFRISADVYRPILVQAVRMLFYQRAGFPKWPPFAAAPWIDSASHLGPGQDTQARLFSAPNDPSTARDLHGGWYDAGDLNRYTPWAARYVVQLLHAYLENPGVWTDDYGIPESGNGVPDLLDEVKWELDWLVRMQNPDGSMLSILGVSHASPPSEAKGPSYYGPPNTISALAAASAFALGAKVYGANGRFRSYADDLARRAGLAWAWAAAHPRVIFRNNDAAFGSEGLGSGQQETDDFGRAMERLVAAVHLFDLTGDPSYRAYVDAHYREARMFARREVSPVDAAPPMALLYYAGLPGASPAVAADIRRTFAEDVGPIETWAASPDGRDPYLAYLSDYTWGSSSVKARQGLLLIEAGMLGPQVERRRWDDAASGYLHHLHGENPLGKVYLSNMGAFGATNSVADFYHTWFGADSQRDSSGWKSGPPPGYLVGGPDAHYTWDPRCPHISPACGPQPPSPPADQPPQKSYKDFSTGWPLDSWEITEPDVGYQAAYIRLLSKFVH